MTFDKRQEQLSETWHREQSADDAHDEIWGEPFDGYTVQICKIQKIIGESSSNDEAIDKILELIKQK